MFRRQSCQALSEGPAEIAEHPEPDEVNAEQRLEARDGARRFQEPKVCLCSMNRAQTNGQTEERATPGGAEMVHNFASTNGGPVEGPIGVLDQSHGERAIAILRVEAVHRRQPAG